MAESSLFCPCDRRFFVEFVLVIVFVRDENRGMICTRQTTVINYDLTPEADSLN